MLLSIEDCRKTLARYGQEHLLRFWDELNEQERAQLLENISEIDFAQVSALWDACQAELSGNVEKVDARLQCFPEELCGSMLQSSEADLQRYFEKGLEQIANNRVACLLLAGGQGTRLGVSYPKGMYKVGLPSGKTLYEIQADRLKKVRSLAASRFSKAGCRVPWYIMTSEHTQTETQRFFEAHGYFGIDVSDVTMFEQFTLPALTREGKCILESRSHVSAAPDGNGGLYRAMAHHGVLQDMKKRGVQYVFVYCVDNILVKMADPHFIGFSVERGAECGNKVVEKCEPSEPVGVMGLLDGHAAVVEYSEITKETAAQRNGQTLLFNAGNICNHFFTTAFLERVISEHVDQLRHHLAFKKVPFVDDNGVLVKPTQPNGIKLEKFVFDVFPFANLDRFATWFVRREDEFAPLKNADGPQASESPTTCRAALFYLHARQLLRVGASIAYRTAAASNYEAQQNSVSEWRVADSNSLNDQIGLRSLCESGAIAVELDAKVSYFGEAIEFAQGRLVTSPSFISTPFLAHL